MPLYEDGAAGNLQRDRGVGLTERQRCAVAPTHLTGDWCRSGNRVHTFPALLAREVRDYDGCQAGPAMDRHTQGR
ncbi:hypothetical protein PSAC2689_100165 [Paraburkholderia sacchari]